MAEVTGIRIDQLPKASAITALDLLVLQQDSAAKKVEGQQLMAWLTAAADGHGGIKKIEKIETSGLVDTYRVTLADSTPFDFTVTNGEKGDQGDKGDKGDTGDPATLVSTSVQYQVSDSGTIAPTGTWSDSVPSVAQGKYLWTKNTYQFNSGEPITAYSVSRMGLDGLGSVVSVCGVSPNENGNVPLGASDVNALSINGGSMEGPINMNGQTINGLNAPTASGEAANKGYVDSKMSMTALWTNSSPGNGYGDTPITLTTMLNYSWLMITYRSYKGAAYYQRQLIPVVNQGSLSTSRRSRLETVMGGGYYRDAVISDTGLTFTYAKKYDTDETSNEYCTPMQIHGLKFT
jgi:hypothetical protein